MLEMKYSSFTESCNSETNIGPYVLEKYILSQAGNRSLSFWINQDKRPFLTQV